MEFHQLRYFVAICEHGSFSRAAEACDVTQPALTAAIKKLEVEVGSELFRREGKRVALTSLGAMLKPHLEQALSETRAAQDVARNFHLLKRAPLRVGTIPTIGAVRLARFFETFREAQRGIDVTVHQAPLPELLHELEAEELDVAIASTPDGLADAFRSESLYKEPYVVVFPPGHPFERLANVALADTSGHDYVDRLACELRETVMGVCAKRGIELYAAFRSDREDWVQSLVLAGLGFAFMPQFSVTLDGLPSRPLVDPAVEREVLAIDVRGRKRSPAAQLLFEAFHAYTWPVRKGTPAKAGKSLAPC